MSQSQSAVGDRQDKVQKKELAHAVLLFEHQLESYRRLHEEEIATLRQTLDELKRRLVVLGIQPDDEEQAADS